MCTEPGTGTEDLPFCDIFNLNECYLAGVRSYTINTRGLEAGKGPIIEEDFQTIEFHLLEDVSAPWADVNYTCK